MDNLEIFENACNYFSDNIVKFKDILTEKVAALKDKEWVFDKGSTKVFKADETGRKKRCKTGIAYRLKIELTEADAETVWDNFNIFFVNSSFKNKQKKSKNSKMLKNYKFISIILLLILSLLFYSNRIF